MKQIGAQQETLREKAAELSSQADAIMNQAHDLALQPQAQQQAAQVAGELDRAEAQSAQAARQLNRPAAASTAHPGSPPPANAAAERQSIQQEQQAAATALNGAALALAGLERSLDQAAVQAHPARPAPSDPAGSRASSVPEAFRQMGSAASSQRAIDAIRAAEELNSAAQEAQAAAKSAGMNPRPPQLKESADGSGLNPGGLPPPENGPKWVKKMGTKLWDWVRFRGELSDHVLQAGADEGPEEYRGMIKQYFHEVARQGGEAP